MTAAGTHPAAATIGVQAGTIEAGRDIRVTNVVQGFTVDDVLRLSDRQEIGRRHGAVAGNRLIGSPIRLFENVPSRDLNFIGREDYLAELHKLLINASQPTAITQAAIHGLGGIGKTTLAAEYAHRYAEAYAGVWWAPAEMRAALIGSLASFAEKLDPHLADKHDQETTAKAGLANLANLAGSPKPFLLIYDNVEAPDTLRHLMPPVGARVLITTRWSDWGGRAAELKLNVLGLDAAADLLQRRSGHSDRLGAARLAEALGCLPLALDHAGAYCKLTASNFDAYRELLDLRIAKAPKGVAYPTSIAGTFGIAIDKAISEHPAAETLLAFFAFVAPDHIPLDLLADEIVSKDDLNEGLMALAALSLVEPGSTTDNVSSVSLHRLIQAAMRQRLASSRRWRATVKQVTRRLVDVFPKVFSAPTLAPRCAALLPHVINLRMHVLSDNKNLTRQMARLLDATDAYLQWVGPRRPTHWLGAARSAPMPVAGRLLNLAQGLKYVGKYSDAERLYRDVITIGQQEQNRHLLADAHRGLASLMVDAGRKTDGIRHMREVLTCHRSSKSDPFWFYSMHGDLAHLVSLLRAVGQTEEALQEVQAMLAFLEKPAASPLGWVSHSSTWLIKFATLSVELLQDLGRDSECEALRLRYNLKSTG